MKKIDDVKKLKIKASPVHYVTGIVFIAFIALTLYFVLKPVDKRTLLETGTIEKTTLSTGFVIKNESVIKKDTNKVLIPVIAEGSKTQKGGIIATYKGEEYQNYEETLTKLDREILELMNDLPVVYSSEVDAIDSIIYNHLKECSGATSYAKMQEYKQRINSEINKRAKIIAELSPDGAEIKDLISKRNKYEQEAKKTNDNILAPITGVVSYKTDGLETKLSTKNINDISYEKIKEEILQSGLIDNTSIKVVNNYEAYIVTKVPLEDKKHLNLNYDYTLRLIENNNYEVKGELVKISETKDGIELCFKITNGIELIATAREIELEIIWWKSKGLVIDNEALVKYENKEEYYLYVVKYSEIVQIPSKIVRQNDKYSVVTNYNNEELEELGLETQYKLKLHDRIIIKND